MLTISIIFAIAFLIPRCELGTGAVYRITHSVSFSKVSASDPVTVTLLINAESRPYLALLESRFTPEPASVQEIVAHIHPGDDGQQALLVTWLVDEPMTVSAEFKVVVYQTHYRSSIISGDEPSIQQYLASTEWYPVENPLVQKIANEISADLWWRSNTEKARAAYNYVKENIRYDTSMLGVHDAIRVLDEGRGVCEGLAYAFATLARALGVPARVYYGRIIDPTIRGIFWAKHAWTEFWDGWNWVPADPTLRNFGTLSIHPYVHMTFDVWGVDIHNGHGQVWPVNQDRRVSVSLLALDWWEFNGYDYTVWTYASTIVDHLWTAAAAIGALAVRKGGR